MVKNLVKVQAELKAPKSNYNSFGKYKYRSAEDILTAVKPLLEKYDLQMVITDTLEHVGDRYYVRATVLLMDADGQQVTITAYAREDESKKGMDGAQVTGTASSYARKYALNGLFLIDDTKDPDTDEYYRQTEKIAEQKIGDARAKTLESQLSAKGVTVDAIYKQYGVTRLADLTEDQHSNIIVRLSKSGNNRQC